MSDEEIIERNIQDLLHIALVEQDAIVSSHVIDAGEVYPGISVGYEAEVERVNKLINDLSNIICMAHPRHLNMPICRCANCEVYRPRETFPRKRKFIQFCAS